MNGFGGILDTFQEENLQIMKENQQMETTDKQI